jgi:holo-[acyl-carrier protein] synthase
MMDSEMGTSTPTWRAAVGVDIIEIGRIERVLLKWQDSFLKRIYTRAELESHYNVSSLAARFAAKEAVMKALGTGNRGVNWREIEILTNVDGTPVVRLHGQACQKSKEVGIAGFSVTLSHSRQYAVAFVIGHAQ